MIPPPEGDPAPDLYREAAGLLRRLADVFDRLAAADPVPEAGPAATPPTDVQPLGAGPPRDDQPPEAGPAVPPPAEAQPPPPGPAGQPPPGPGRRSGLGADLEALPGAQAGPWRAAGAALHGLAGPDEEADALARLLADPPAPFPDGLAEAVARWAGEYPEAAAARKIAPASTVDLPATGSERPELAFGAARDERPGLRLGDRLVLPPQIVLVEGPDAAAARHLWSAQGPPPPWPHLLDLVTGGRDPDAMRSLLAWSGGRDAADVHEVLALLRARGALVLDEPEGPEDPRFAFVRRAAAAVAAPGRRIARPAVVLGDFGTLREGLVFEPAATRPSPAAFLQAELLALDDDLAAYPPPPHRLFNVREEPTSREALRRQFEKQIRDFADAPEADRPRRARAFGSFILDVLRVTPGPPEAPPAAWAERQRLFRGAAAGYLGEFDLAEATARVGTDASAAQGCFHCIPATRRRGGRFGQVVEVRAPALVDRSGGNLLLKGTLYYVGAA